MKNTFLLSLALTQLMALPSYAQQISFEAEQVNELTLDSEVEAISADEVAEEQQLAKQEAAKAREEARAIKQSYKATKTKNAQLRSKIKTTMREIDRLQGITTDLRRKVRSEEALARRNERDVNKVIKAVERLNKMEHNYRERLANAIFKNKGLHRDIKEAQNLKVQSENQISRLTKELQTIRAQNKLLRQKRIKARKAASLAAEKAKRLERKVRGSGMMKVGRK